MTTSRVIVCKLGRLGELRKILDRTTPNPVAAFDKDEKDSKDAKKRKFDSLTTVDNRASITKMSPAAMLPRVPVKQQSTLLELLSSDQSSPSLSEQQQQPFSPDPMLSSTSCSEIQLLSENGGVLINERLKNAILALHVGDAVSIMSSADEDEDKSFELSSTSSPLTATPPHSSSQTLFPSSELGGPDGFGEASSSSNHRANEMEYTDDSPGGSPSPRDIKLFECLSPCGPRVTTVVQASEVTTYSQQQQPSSPGSPDRQHCSSTTLLTSEGLHLLSGQDSIKDEDDACPKRMCLVCGDVASGFHYGVSSCEACKAFFKRTIQGIANRQGNIEYTCPASNDCEINKRRRKACQACRFQKCLRMGMLKEGVRLDRVRGGRQKYRRLIDNPYGSVQPTRKLSLEENKLLVALTRCDPEPTLALPDPTLPEDQYKIISTLSDFYDRELVGTIGWAKQIPGFTDLSLNDQMRLLQGSWSEILTLTLVFRSLPRSGRLNFAADFALTEAEATQGGLREFYLHCVKTTERLERIGIQKEEYLLLKAIIISNCDVRVEEYSALWRLRDNLLSALYDCVAVIRSGNPTIHVQNLLLILPSIRQADSLVRKFWRTVQEDSKVTLNKLLVEMLEAQSK